MSQIIYINILVDWSLNGKMTSKLVIRESEFHEFVGHYPIQNSRNTPWHKVNSNYLTS